MLKWDKPFVQRPDGKGWKGHVQQTPLGIEEQTRRAISKQSLAPDLQFMNKVMVKNSKRLSVTINKQNHTGF